MIHTFHIMPINIPDIPHLEGMAKYKEADISSLCVCMCVPGSELQAPRVVRPQGAGGGHGRQTKTRGCCVKISSPLLSWYSRVPATPAMPGATLACVRGFVSQCFWRVVSGQQGDTCLFFFNVVCLLNTSLYDILCKF